MAASVEKLRRAEQMAREMGDRDAEEFKAAMETEKQAAEREHRMSEVNVFSLDPNGFKTHWKIVSGTTGEDLNKMMQHQGVLSKWLLDHHYKPDDMGRGEVAPIAVSSPPMLTAPAGAAVWVQNPDGTKSCSLHGQGAFQAPGVSRRTGQPYAGFWKCTVKDCKPTGEN